MGCILQLTGLGVTDHLIGQVTLGMIVITRANNAHHDLAASGLALVVGRHTFLDPFHQHVV